MIGNIGRFQTDTFAVNVQPFFVDSKIPMLVSSPLFFFFLVCLSLSDTHSPMEAPTLPTSPPTASTSRQRHMPKLLWGSGTTWFVLTFFYICMSTSFAYSAFVLTTSSRPRAAKIRAGTWDSNPVALQSKPLSSVPPPISAAQTPVLFFLNIPLWLLVLSNVEGVREFKPTGGEAPAPTLTVEQRTMLGIALVLIVAVPIALFVYRRVARRRGYSPISPSVNSDSATTVV
jgi:hypothetical protein